MPSSVKAVKYGGEMLGCAFPASRRLAHCLGCRKLIKEVAEDCWVDYYVYAAQCPDGGMHRPMPVEQWIKEWPGDNNPA